jgi:homoserine dehydrogenase
VRGFAIPALREIDSLAAVLNGTCNFVLDACAEGASLTDAVAQAQQRGFAEADPSEDLSGRDAMRKLTILARHAFNTELDAIPLQALDEPVAQAARRAAQSGMKLRQVARAARRNGHIVAAAEFEEVDSGSLFGKLTGEWNGLEVRYANGHTVSLRGRGAGCWPTAEAVMADVFEIARDRARAT